MRSVIRETTGERGSVLALTLVVVMAMVTLVTLQASLMHDGLRQAHAYATRFDLRMYAESGFTLAAHDFDNYVSGNQGNVGTIDWTSDDDIGADRIAGSLDSGEGDGIPTPGEPNLAPVPIGPPEIGARLLVSVYPTPYSGVFRIVSTCFTATETVTLERVYGNELERFALPSATYVNPEMQLEVLAGANLLLSGNDSSTSGGGETLPGLTTNAGESPGDHLLALLSQTSQAGQLTIEGADGTPSVGEIDGDVFGPVFDTFRGKATRHLVPGSYTDLNISQDYSLLLSGMISSWSGGSHDTTTSDSSGFLSMSTTRSSTDSTSTSTSTQSTTDSTLRSSSLFTTSTDTSGVYEETDGTLMGGTTDTLEQIAVPIIYSDGDLQLSGEGGKGILVVNGSVSLSGPFQFEGVLIVRGDVAFDAAAGDIQMVGGLMVDGSLIQAVAGVTEIRYSSQTLEWFRGNVRSYSPLHYREF